MASPDPKDRIDKILDDIDWGYTYRMSDYATSHEQESKMEKEGLEEVAEVKSQILELVRYARIEELEWAKLNGSYQACEARLKELEDK